MNSNVMALQPAPDANKYSRGKLVVVAGSARYPGAAVLAARAGQRMGAGYTEVITSRDAIDLVRMSAPSLVVRSFGKWNPRSAAAGKGKKPCAVCIGPGFVGDKGSADLVARVLKQAACPVVVDGGGLAGLGSAKTLKRLSKRAKKGLPTVVTPHEGEAARLAKSLKLSTKNPEKLAKRLSQALHAIVVLKGPDTYIANGKHVEVVEEGTAALAKAGTGDVLAGMIGALLAQGVEPFDAAVTGVTLHARAGKTAAERLTDIAVCAEDVIGSIPEVLKQG